MSTLRVLRSILAVAVTIPAAGLLLWAAQQEPVQSGPPPDDLALRRAALAGHWTLHPFREGTPPPPPPPFYTQRSPDDRQPPLESVARVRFRVDAEAISGTAVFPEGIVLTDQNRDVTGRPGVELDDVSFDGTQLKFQATVEGKRLEAELEAKGSRFFGRWRVAGSEEAGDLYLVRRR